MVYCPVMSLFCKATDYISTKRAHFFLYPLLCVFVEIQIQHKEEDRTMWSVTLRLLWFLPFFFHVFHRFNTQKEHCFVRQLITFLPKEHTIYVLLLLFYIMKNNRKRQEQDAHDVVSYVTSFVVLALIFVILYA